MHLTWEIYIHPPDRGYKYPTHTIFDLHKKLFRRQAWFAKLNATISWLGFSSNPYDCTLFIHDIDKGITFFFFGYMLMTWLSLAKISFGIEEKRSFSHH